LASDVSVEKEVLDVNVLAVFLVKDHPGNEYVTSIVEDGLRGVFTPIIMDIIPIRAFWIMTRKWGCPEKDSAEAIEHFVKAYDRPRYTCLRKESILEGFRLAKKLRHDVFDCIYLAFALQEDARAIVTTDTDFEQLCKHTGLEYVNPVPKEVLKRFKEQNK